MKTKQPVMPLISLSIVLFFSLSFINCSGSDDNNDNSCETFLECHAGKTWLSILPWRREYLKFTGNTANPFEIWNNEGPDGMKDCYDFENYIFGYGANDFTILQNDRQRLVISTNETGNNEDEEITTFSISDQTLIRHIDFPGNDDDDGLFEYSLTGDNVGDLTICD
jgi:hypothetical protein